MTHTIKAKDIFQQSAIDLARGLLDKSNPNNSYLGHLGMTKSDVQYWLKSKKTPKATGKHRVRREVECVKVLKTKAIGIAIRKGDVFQVETPMPFEPNAIWTATARLGKDSKPVVKLEDLTEVEFF